MLTHDYHFICTKYNVEMDFLDNFEKPYKWIVFVECPKCKFPFEMKKKKYYMDLIRDLRDYRFICTKCNVDMIYLDGN